MRMFLPTFLILILFSQISFAQGNSQVVTVVGDSLIGKMVDGKNIREVIGNVVMTQGDVTITCNKAIQYLADNRAHLIGNVVINQDSIVIQTDEGFYLGNEKIAYSDKHIYLNDGKLELTASMGYYYTDEKKANFIGDVNMIDSTNALKSDRLLYYYDDEKIDAAGNVFIQDTTSSISADSLVHFKKTGSTFAFGNVIVSDLKNNITMSGDQLTDLKEEKYSKITGTPLFIQIDTTDSGQIDTLVISSMLMEQVNDSTRKFIATDSVKIFRGNFSSINDRSILFTDEDRILTIKLTDESRPPVLWYENSQLVGDSVNIFLKDNQLNWIDVRQKASIISESKKHDFRYDQLSGDNIKMFFGENSIKRTEVNGSVLSIYYMIDEDEPSGLLKSSAKNAVIYFDNSTVSNVRLYGSPVSEYHPENVIIGKEKDFTLPTFIIYEGRPDKESILSKRNYKK